MAQMKQPARGILFARAEGGAAPIIAELQKTFSDFKAAHAEEMKGVKAQFADVVTKEKVERIDARLNELQGALDAASVKMAAANIGAGGEKKVRDGEYTKAFSAHFRKGEVLASLNKGTAAEGGYLAPVEWDRTITDKLVKVSPMRTVCSVISISTNGFTKLFNKRGTASGWVGEIAARPETAGPTLGQMTYNTGEIYANPSATQQLLDDAEIDVEAWLASEVQTEFAYQEGVAFLSGDGTNKPTGLLTYVAGGANAAVHPFGAIAAVNSGIAADIEANSIINLVYALPQELTGNARFAMNRNTISKVRKLTDSSGWHLWQPSLEAGQPATLAGYPLTEMAGIPDVAANAISALFGDFARTYQIVDRIGVRVLRDPFTNKPFVNFYTTKRVGGGLLNPETMKALKIAA